MHWHGPPPTRRWRWPRGGTASQSPQSGHTGRGGADHGDRELLGGRMISPAHQKITVLPDEARDRMNAFLDATEDLDTPRLNAVSLLGANVRPVEFLVPGYVPKHFTLLVGDGGGYKTTLCFTWRRRRPAARRSLTSCRRARSAKYCSFRARTRWTTFRIAWQLSWWGIAGARRWSGRIWSRWHYRTSGSMSRAIRRASSRRCATTRRHCCAAIRWRT